jgi:hypothetical protein
MYISQQVFYSICYIKNCYKLSIFPEVLKAIAPFIKAYKYLSLPGLSLVHRFYVSAMAIGYETPGTKGLNKAGE